MIMAAVGTAVSVMGQIQQGKQANKISQYNAAVAQQNAEATRQSYQYQADQKRAESEKTLARQRALYGKAGVELSGTPLDLMAETASEYEMDALMLEREGKLAIYRGGSQSEIDLLTGKSSKTASYYGAGSTLLTGGSSMLNAYGTKVKKTTASGMSSAGGRY